MVIWRSLLINCCTIDICKSIFHISDLWYSSTFVLQLISLNVFDNGNGDDLFYSTVIFIHIICSMIFRYCIWFYSKSWLKIHCWKKRGKIYSPNLSPMYALRECISIVHINLRINIYSLTFTAHMLNILNSDIIEWLSFLLFHFF